MAVIKSQPTPACTISTDGKGNYTAIDSSGSVMSQSTDFAHIVASCLAKGGKTFVTNGVYTSKESIILPDHTPCSLILQSEAILQYQGFNLLVHSNGVSYNTVTGFELSGGTIKNTGGYYRAINVGWSDHPPKDIYVHDIQIVGSEIWIEYGSYITVKNVNVHDLPNNPNFDAGISAGNASNVLVTGCTVSNVPYMGINVYGDHVEVSNNKVTSSATAGGGSAGIDCANSYDLVVMDNILANLQGAGILSENSQGPVTIQHNTVSNCAGQAIQVWSTPGSTTYCSDADISDNTITNSALGILFHSVESGSIKHNTLTNIGGTAISVNTGILANITSVIVSDDKINGFSITRQYQDGISFPDYTIVHDNTVNGNNVATYGRGIAFNNTAVSHAEMYDNAVYNTTGPAYFDTSTNSAIGASATRMLNCYNNVGQGS